LRIRRLPLRRAAAYDAGMGSGTPFGSRHPIAVLALLFLALALRAVIPAGFMLAPDDAGRIGLVACSGSAPAATHHHHHGHDRNAPAEQPCPFAIALAAATPPAPPALILAMAPAAEPAIAPAHRETPGAPSPTLLPPATGPPAFL
jgi:hypothetical protein